ncbi:MAG: type II and III secretion system protein, partial [Candidatus Omnitrophota bacterium]
TTQSTGTTTVAEDVTFVDVGVKLRLTPTINDDGFVTLKLKPEISSVVRFLQTSEENQIPIINTSSAETTVIVKDGATIIIGGLKEELEKSDVEETPFFSRIPLLGNLLRSSVKTKERSELILMVTPFVISGDELVTGYGGDFGYRFDKKDQAYLPFVDEPMPGTFKSYQGYSDFQKGKAQQSLLKPQKKGIRSDEK